MGNQESYPMPTRSDSLRHYLIQMFYIIKPHNDWDQTMIDRLITNVQHPLFGTDNEADREWTHRMLFERFIEVTLETGPHDNFNTFYAFISVTPDTYIVLTNVFGEATWEFHHIYTWDELVHYILNVMPPFETVEIKTGYDPSASSLTRVYGCSEGGQIPEQLYDGGPGWPYVETKNCMTAQEKGISKLESVQALARKKIAQRRNRNVIKGISRDISYRPPSGAFPGGEGYLQTQAEFDRARNRQRDLLDEEKKE